MSGPRPLPSSTASSAAVVPIRSDGPRALSLLGPRPHAGATDLLPRSKVAPLLGVSRNTVTRWAREGRLASLLTLGGQHRFDREHIEQLRSSLYRAACNR